MHNFSYFNCFPSSFNVMCAYYGSTDLASLTIHFSILSSPLSLLLEFKHRSALIRISVFSCLLIADVIVTSLSTNDGEPSFVAIVLCSEIKTSLDHFCPSATGSERRKHKNHENSSILRQPTANIDIINKRNDRKCTNKLYRLHFSL